MNMRVSLFVSFISKYVRPLKDFCNIYKSKLKDIYNKINIWKVILWFCCKVYLSFENFATEPQK
ncbi:hypothetical protein FO521_09810 [Bacillus pseudomycoides]|nr:hypothetical protein [Bacillus pseudomycoides]